MKANSVEERVKGYTRQELVNSLGYEIVEGSCWRFRYFKNEVGYGKVITSLEENEDEDKRKMQNEGHD